jgi:hypothetical protein
VCDLLNSTFAVVLRNSEPGGEAKQNDEAAESSLSCRSVISGPSAPEDIVTE